MTERLVRRNVIRPFVPLFILASTLCAYASITTGGRDDVVFMDLFAADSLAASVMWDIRLPRTVVAMCVGVNLGLAGLILQAITRNPLASPTILGINQGAAFGLVIGLVFPASAALIGLKTLAIIGAFTAGVVTFTIAGGLKGRIDGLRLVLGGVAVGAFSYAMVRFTFTLEDNLAREVLRWTVGNITDMRWVDVHTIAGWSAGGLIATALITQRLNLMALGEASSAGLGSDPRLTLLIGAVISAILTGTSVAVAGPIAFVGLVVPHVCRMIFGVDHRRLVFVVAMVGAVLMMAADAVSKWLTAPIETPIGVIVAMIGVPCFLYQALFAKDIE